MDKEEINKIIEDFRFEEERKDRQEKLKREEELRKSFEEAQQTFKNLLDKLKPAIVEDYNKWIRGFIASGGKPTHSYNYNFPNDFYIALIDFDFKFPLYGARAINILIPKGIKFLGGPLGHCNLYFYDQYSTRGSWVPIYNDVIV